MVSNAGVRPAERGIEVRTYQGPNIKAVKKEIKDLIKNNREQYNRLHHVDKGIIQSLLQDKVIWIEDEDSRKGGSYIRAYQPEQIYLGLRIKKPLWKYDIIHTWFNSDFNSPMSDFLKIGEYHKHVESLYQM